MRAVKVGRTRQRVTERGRHRTATVIRFAHKRLRAFIVTQGDIPFVEHDKGDIWLPAALIIAMRRGERLVLADPISDDRRASLDAIQDLFVSWYPERMKRVAVHAPPSDAPRGIKRLSRRVNEHRRPPRDEASCFTGGIDSFYSRMTNNGVDAIVYAFGLDIPLEEKAACKRVDTTLRDIAAESGDRYIWLRTNLRELLRWRTLWGHESHGAVLASLGTVLAPAISTLRIPATHTNEADIAWGSHPELDPLWSTSTLRIVHDGGDASRAVKTARLAGEPLAQRHLRVCYEQFETTNCGECMKCLRTMATLQLLGRLEAFETFERPLDIDLLRSMSLRTPNDAFQIRDVLGLAEAVPGHEDLKDALASLLAAHEERDLVPAGGPVG
jgi:hypothetical protein